MPCDPYTETNYFETIGKMVECVLRNVVELILMGIAPSFPFEKYSYVVSNLSEGFNGSKKVLRFTKKPNVQCAKELLAENAYWNGGVFAFRLGYMMNIVRKYITSDSFEDTLARYAEFPRISFDYEVAEKVQSVAVVPFAGQWKDLGTWNALIGELHCSVIGNAVMGAHCENTHVLNEFQRPIYVDGFKDVVVVACLDGILVFNKNHFEEIKKAVEKLISRPMYEERRWGNYRVLDDSSYESGQLSLTKSITLNLGKTSHIRYITTVLKFGLLYKVRVSSS